MHLEKDCIGKPIEEVFLNPDQIVQTCKKAIVTQDHHSLEHISISDSNTVFEFVKFVPISSPSGVQYCGLILDTPYTAVKNMTDDRMVESIFMSSPNAMLIQSIDGEVFKINPSFTEMFGWKDYEIIGKGISLFPCGFEKEHEEIVRQLQKKEVYIIPNTKRVHKDGSVKDVSICYMNIYNHLRERTAVARLYIDISKQTLFHTKYLEQRNSLQLITENMKDLVAISDFSGKVVYASPSHVEITGYSAESYLNRKVFRYIHPNDRRHVFEQIKKLVYAGRSAKAEIRYKHASKGYIWIEWIASPLLEGQSQFEKFVVVGRDITHRKRAEEALQESEKKYRLILEKTSDLVVMFNPFGDVDFVSPSLQTWLDHKPLTNIYEFMAQYVVAEDFNHLYEIIHSVFSKKEPEQSTITLEVGEHRFTFDTVLTPLAANDYNSHSEDMILLIARDITKRLEDEHVSMQHEKMSTVGQLAAGIAHELRNPLTSVKGFIHMIGDELRDPLHQNYLEIIRKELDGIERIADEFMDLAKPHVVNVENTELKEIVESCVRLFEGTAFLKGIHIYVDDISNEDIVVNGQKSALKRVFINIMKNAMEAMDKGGTLAITVKRRENYVDLYFSDSGIGIEKERLKYIGEPFYSTKEKGIGLGLMMSRKIIREHGGRLSIESEYLKGTTICIVLPLSTTHVEHQKIPSY